MLKRTLILLLVFLTGMVVLNSSVSFAAAPVSNFDKLDEVYKVECFGCRYFSIIYDTVSMGSYRLYQAQKPMALLILAFGLAFWILTYIFDSVVMKQSIDYNAYSQDFGKKFFKAIAVVAIVFSLSPITVFKYSTDLIFNIGITAGRSVLHYKMNMINDEESNPMSNFDIYSVHEELEIKQPYYCSKSNNDQRYGDAKRIERERLENGTNFILPEATKLDFLCMLKEASILQRRYRYLGYLFRDFQLVELTTKTFKTVVDGIIGFVKKINILDQIKKTNDNLENHLEELVVDDEIATVEKGREINIFQSILIIIAIIAALVLTIWLFTVHPILGFAALAIFIILPFLFLDSFRLFLVGIIFSFMYWLFRLAFPLFLIEPFLMLVMAYFLFPLFAVAWVFEDSQKAKIPTFMSSIISGFQTATITVFCLCLCLVFSMSINEVFMSEYLVNFLKIKEAMDSGTIAFSNDLFPIWDFLIMICALIISLIFMDKAGTIAGLFGGGDATQLFGTVKTLFEKGWNKAVGVTKGAIRVRKIVKEAKGPKSKVKKGSGGSSMRSPFGGSGGNNQSSPNTPSGLLDSNSRGFPSGSNNALSGPENTTQQSLPSPQEDSDETDQSALPAPEENNNQGGN